MKNKLIFIFARGGSKGIKNKNIYKINKKPLIQYTIDIAKKICRESDIYVSSDSNKIINIAKKNNISFIERPKSISGDSSIELDAWKHAINYLNYEKKIYFKKFISLPTTSPLRSVNDVKKCIRMLDKNVDIVVTVTKAKTYPWFNMLEKNSLGYFNLIYNKKLFFNRQEAPLLYDMTTVAYVTKPEYIIKTNHILKGKVKSILIPEERSLDIDTMFDMKLAKMLIKNEEK